MRTRMYLTFSHLDEKDRSELLRLLQDAVETMPTYWASRTRFALNHAEFVDLAMIVPDDSDHPKRENEP